MSFYMVSCFEDKILMATDGAGYFSDGTIATIGQKVYPVEGYPVAITARGDVAGHSRIVSVINQVIQQVGSLEVAMKLLGDQLPERGRRTADPISLEVCIAGMTAYGPAIYHFRTQAEEGYVEPFKLYECGETIICGIETPSHHRNITEENFGRYAVTIVDELRAKHARSREEVTDVTNCVVMGGHLDLTTITADGVAVERFHEWPEDQVGHKVEPAAAQTVVPLIAQKLNRKSRRAAARHVA